MTTFHTNPDVNAFETVGPNGLIRVEAGTPFETKDAREIGLLESYGAHALTKSAKAPVKAEKIEKGGEES